jgi:hypothetical protein
MHKLVGILCVAVAVFLLVRGYDAAHHLGSKVYYMFAGHVPVRARYLLIGGVVLFGLGAFQIYTAKK